MISQKIEQTGRRIAKNTATQFQDTAEKITAEIKSTTAILNDKIDSTNARILHLHQSVAELATQQQMNQLNRRLDDLESSIAERLSEPVTKQLILLYDLLPGSHDQGFTPLVAAIGDEILEILRLGGIENYRAEGDQLDPSRQRCIGYLSTGSQTVCGTIARRERSGFKNGTKTIRHEEVVVWRYEPQTPITS